MRLKPMIISVFMVAFGLTGVASAASQTGGHGSEAGHGDAGHSSGRAHEGAGHVSARLGSRISSIGLGTREESELAKMGFVDAHEEMIGGHNATVAVFHRAPLTATERDRLYHYHFKGFNQCAGHGACAEPKVGGEEMYCRRVRNVAITSDLECLSFRRSE
jgi:hypothetical protein